VVQWQSGKVSCIFIKIWAIENLEKTLHLRTFLFDLFLAFWLSVSLRLPT